MKYLISVELDELEMMEIASMVWGVPNWEDDKQGEPIARAFTKIRGSIIGQVNPDQRVYLARITKAVQNAFNTPSIESGMTRGGLAGIMERITEEMENKED